MRPNIVTEAGLPTRMNQWWASVPFITSGVVIICGIIYLVCLLVGYDSFYEVCFLPSEVISRFQVYRAYTSTLFHGSLLHIVFNMLAMVPLGAELERTMGSVRLLFVIVLLATSNSIFHIIIVLLISHNPVHPLLYLMDECAIGFSGIIFSLIVIETRLSGVQSRSVFGLFNVPAQWYAWILLILFQFLASNVSLLGHLCGILSGFAYTNGLFNYILPGPAFFAAIESSSISACVRRPGFILSTGGNTYGHIPTFSHPTTTSSGLNSRNLWRSVSSWIPRRVTPSNEPAQDSRFPGRGRVLGGTRNTSTHVESNLNLQARHLDDSLNHPLETLGPIREPHLTETRNVARHNEGTAGAVLPNQDHGNFDDELGNLVVMGFEKARAEIALAAADGDPNVAIEILMSQQGQK